MEDLNHEVHSADDLSLFCCQNRRCVVFGTRGAGSLCVRDRIGKHKQIRLLYCKACKKRLSETKGTVFYRSRLPRERVVSILQHVQEGNGLRQTGRLEHVKEDAPRPAIATPAKPGGPTASARTGRSTRPS